MTIRGSIIGAALLSVAPLSFGFSLLDHPSPAQVASGDFLKWDQQPGEAWQTLSFAIADDFLSNESPEVRDAAIEAVLNALQSWSDATHQYVRFVPSPFDAVENHDVGTGPGCPQNCALPIVQFEGPSWDQWFDLGQPSETPPGWGANIDIFSRPPGFRMTSNGVEYRMRNNILGFAAIHRTGNRIASVDIYINSAQPWYVDIEDPDKPDGEPTTPDFPVYYGGGRPAGYIGNSGPQAVTTFGDGQRMDDADAFGEDKSGVIEKSGRGIGRFSCTGGYCVAHGVDHEVADGERDNASAARGGDVAYDVETLILHELGHALGLDHGDEAEDAGGAFLHPYTAESLDPDLGDDANLVLYSAYTGIKRELSTDDLGGVAFLYPNQISGDVTVDGVVSVDDAMRAIELYQSGAQPTPFEVRTLDLASPNGNLDFDDVVALIDLILIDTN